MNTPASASLLKVVGLIKSGSLDGFEHEVEVGMKSDLPDIQGWINLGIACAQHNRLNEAVLIFKLLRSIAEPDLRVLYNLGLAYAIQGKLHEALEAYNSALEMNPVDTETLINKASVLNDMGAHAQALDVLEMVLASERGIPEALLNQGIAYNHLALYPQAIAAYDEAIRLRPDYLEAWSNKSVPLNNMGRHQQALDACRHALRLNSGDVNANLNLGNTLFLQKDYTRALDVYDLVLNKNPECAEAYAVKGKVLHALQRYDLAIASYDAALKLDPSQNWVLGQSLHAKMEICQWNSVDNDLQRLEGLIEAGKKVILPFPLLGLIDHPGLQKSCAEIYAKQEFPKNPSLGISQPWPKGDKIKIAYYSADLHAHAVAYLIAEIFELHDRAAFEMIGISFAQIQDGLMRDRIVKAFDQFIEVDSMGDAEVAQLSRDLKVDIAIDLMGYTQNSRTGIFAHRAAPVQINYLGYPGTMGAEYMDYIIADKVVIPSDSQADYSEKVIYLPHSYQPNDSRKQISDRRFTREEVGLPEDGFVFCCFNNNYKILPEVFDVWMRILHAVDNSVLWLFDANPTASQNLKAEAVKRGISESRLIFAPKLPLGEHLARQRLADLFLDTLPYNAHTTASDALWAGLPILTCTGKSFASRVAASLLSAVGLQELITDSLEAYAAKAIALAKNPADLKIIKEKLAKNRLTEPLFNSELMAKSIEKAYKAVHARYISGLEPEMIEIPAE
ncbi:tetratricopeptide repeat protein [Polynucleobacter sp. MWH-Aus1W21]|uniref:O-linked N-acetylglucosamine transferase, SPINDLY family protein n=1 Tax=Polynucleobacter sp. MWH-Aus1W21 TaxID=1855880 RepID=UPI001BFD2F2A|nr:tetratricopeptide repeat protein [Polynucleobacter sp. MWH-Aus1W21]QWD66367.1 tetratricopeptide repeat protein [Polynucleobacter sp. MWH-Aus1W21]